MFSSQPLALSPRAGDSPHPPQAQDGVFLIPSDPKPCSPRSDIVKPATESQSRRAQPGLPLLPPRWSGEDQRSPTSWLPRPEKLILVKDHRKPHLLIKPKLEFPSVFTTCPKVLPALHVRQALCWAPAAVWGAAQSAELSPWEPHGESLPHPHAMGSFPHPAGGKTRAHAP